MTYSVNDALDYRNNIAGYASDLEDAIDELEVATYEDIKDAVEKCRSEIDELMGAIPCEEGIVQFAQDMANSCDHEDYVYYEDVALTHDQLTGHWGNDSILSLNLIKMDDIADILVSLMDDTRIRNTRLALAGLIAELRQGGAWFSIKNDTQYYIDVTVDEIGDVLGVAV